VPQGQSCRNFVGPAGRKDSAVVGPGDIGSEDMRPAEGTAGPEEHRDIAVVDHRRLVVDMRLSHLHTAPEAGLDRAGIHLVLEAHSRLAVVCTDPGSSLELIQLAVVEGSPALGSLAAGDSLAVGRSRAAAWGSPGPGQATRTG